MEDSMAKKDIVKKRKNEVIKEARINEVDKKEPKFIAAIVILVSAIILVIIVLGGLFWYFENKKETNNIVYDSEKFEKEYESYNGQENANGRKYLEIDVDDKNVIKYSSYDEIFSLLEKGTGVIYFGFPTCPWCRNLVPVLLDSSKEAGIDLIYYFNNKEDRDTKELDEDGNITTTKEGTSNYYKLVEKLESYLGEYQGLNDNSVKRLYYPTVIFVKNGKIVDIHIGTVDSQDNPSVFLNDEQYKELKTTLVEKMEKTIVCDDAC